MVGVHRLFCIATKRGKRHEQYSTFNEVFCTFTNINKNISVHATDCKRIYISTFRIHKKIIENVFSIPLITKAIAFINNYSYILVQS